MELYPLKFRTIFKETVWGGNKLTKLLKKPAPAGLIGESWEISAVQGNVSEVANGFLKGNSLQDIIEIYMADLVGEQVYEKFGVEFPLLIKFIDAAKDLSIQVHPNNAKAKERHKAYGKNEMWYVLQADAGATLVSGFNKNTNVTEYTNTLVTNTIPNILNSIEVDKGDTFYIPAGRIHTIGTGILLAEIQQTSDVTYRVYDYNRPGLNGKPRQLHTEWAADVLDYSQTKNAKIEYTPEANLSVNLVSSKYFKTNILNFNVPIENDYHHIDSFIIYICVSGGFTIETDSEKTEVVQGETILLPAALNSVKLYPENGNSEVLEVYIS